MIQVLVGNLTGVDSLHLQIICEATANKFWLVKIDDLLVQRSTAELFSGVGGRGGW